jgi:hypothetical protein
VGLITKIYLPEKTVSDSRDLKGQLNIIKRMVLNTTNHCLNLTYFHETDQNLARTWQQTWQVF